MITVGEKLWRAQKVDAYALRIPGGAVSGTNLTCSELVDRVRSTVVHNVNNLDDSLPDIGVEQVVVDVVEVLPAVGVVVEVGITSSTVDSSAEGLPAGGDLVSEATLRLSHVSLSTGSC